MVRAEVPFGKHAQSSSFTGLGGGGGGAGGAGRSGRSFHQDIVWQKREGEEVFEMKTAEEGMGVFWLQDIWLRSGGIVVMQMR